MVVDPIALTISVVTFFSIYAIMALSLNLEYGVAGVPNFGKALFVSVGAYTAALLMTRVLPLLAGQSFVQPCGATLAEALQVRTQILRTMPIPTLAYFALALVVAALVGAAVGWLFSAPALRLKEEWYLALVLLVGAETIRIFVRSWDPLICGSNGISGIGQPFAWLPDARTRAFAFALLCSVIAAVCWWFAHRFTHSPWGRLLKAVRENEVAAATLGKDVPRARGAVMMIGSAMAAVAGVLFVMNTGFASANDYTVALTLDVWVMIVLGGLGNMRGALIGALIVTLVDRFTSIYAIRLDMMGFDFEFSYIKGIVFGVLVLLMLRFRPQGLAPERLHTTLAHKYAEGQGDHARNQ